MRDGFQYKSMLAIIESVRKMCQKGLFQERATVERSLKNVILAYLRCKLFILQNPWHCDRIQSSFLLVNERIAT